MSRWAVLALRVVIVGVFAGLVAIQVIPLPALWRDVPEEAPGMLPLRWALLLIGMAMVLCVQVALVCVWRLLTMTRKDTVFSTAAFRWVDVVIGAAVVEAGLWALLAVLLAPGEAVPPGIVLIVTTVGAAAFGIGLVVLVMRMLLAKAVALDSTATTLRAELDEVI